MRVKEPPLVGFSRLCLQYGKKYHKFVINMNVYLIKKNQLVMGFFRVLNKTKRIIDVFECVCI